MRLTPEAAGVKKLLESRFPGATVGVVVKSPYFDLYEAQFDERLVYTDAKVTYVMVGSVYDASTKQNLTRAAPAQAEPRRLGQPAAWPRVHARQG